MKENSIQSICPTKTAFIGSRLLNVPFWVLLNLLPVILYKDMHISSWLITIAIVIKPASALFASYWSTWIHQRPDRLIKNIVLANVLRYIPFLFIPWIASPLLIILCFGFYMMLSRGVIPAWMEIFKLNLEANHQSKVFAYGSAADYLATAIFPLFLGLILDDYGQSWRILFPIFAMLGLFSTFFLLKLPKLEPIPAPSPLPFSFTKEVQKPWKESFQLLKKRPDFLQFQIGFMLGGAGLMVMQPIIPIFFVDVLNLSYTKMLLALAVLKAIGFAIASPFWARLFHQINIFRFSSLASFISVLFPLFLITSETHIYFVYAAYFLYGMMQSASELSWHMSGPTFAAEKESSSFTTTNILLVGIRGCFAPILGSLLYSLTGSITVLIAGSLLCLFSALQLFFRPLQEEVTI